MLKEIIFEAVLFAVVVISAYGFGWWRVRLVDRSKSLNEYFTQPPKRPRERTYEARQLAKMFRRRNHCRKTETESLIALPATSTIYIAGFVLAIVMMVVVAKNHFSGIAQLLIFRKIYDDSELLGGWIMAGIILVVATFALSLLLSDVIIPNGVKAHAVKLANARSRRGRTVRFAQALSLDEIGTFAKWAMAEKAEQRAKQRKKKRAAKRHSATEVVSLPMAANH